MHHATQSRLLKNKSLPSDAPVQQCHAMNHARIKNPSLKGLIEGKRQSVPVYQESWDEQSSLLSVHRWSGESLGASAAAKNIETAL